MHWKNRLVMALGFTILAAGLYGLVSQVRPSRVPAGVVVSYVLGAFVTWKARYSPEIGAVEVAAAISSTALSALLCVFPIGLGRQWIVLALIVSGLVFALVGASIKTLISRNNDAWRRKRDIRKSGAQAGGRHDQGTETGGRGGTREQTGRGDGRD